MSAIHQTLFRQWEMLRLIPRHPQRRSTQQIVQGLLARGYRTTDRTVARDLDALSGLFSYTCEEDGRAKLWFWPPDARQHDIPGMEPVTALAWVMSEAYLTATLPPAASRHLRAHFIRAHELLGQHAGHRTARWRDLFFVRQRGPQLQRPGLDASMLDRISEALLDQLIVEVIYQSRSRGQRQQLTLHPQALVLKDGLYYLVAVAEGFADIRHYALHRLEALQLTRRQGDRQRKAILAEYVERAFGYPHSDQTLPLEMWVRRTVADHLRECPLAADQQLTGPDGDQRWHVRATVVDNSELRWWLLGFGDQIQVSSPTSLVKELRSTLDSASRAYQSPGSRQRAERSPG